MRVFIAGPSSGFEKLNFPAFDKAELYLLSQAHCDLLVINPANHRRESMMVEEHKYPTGNLVADGTHSPMQAHGYCCVSIPWDVDQISQCNILALLPGYEKSQYACQLLGLANMMGKMILHIPGAVVDEPLPDDDGGDDDEPAVLAMLPNDPDAGEAA